MIIDEDAYLEHYGVKGMRWGVINDDDPAEANSNRLNALLKKEPPQKHTPEQKKAIAEAKAKHDSHFDKSEDDSPKGWRPTKKQVAVAAGGAIAVGAIIYAYQSGQKVSLDYGTPFSADDYISNLKDMGTPAWASDFAGKKMTPEAYQGWVHNSIGRAWGNGYLAPSSFAQKETTFEAGHLFCRLSSAPEKSFGKATYMTGSNADLARYLAAFDGPSKQLITFKATDQVRVPDLYTRLEAMRVTMHSRGEKDPSPQQVMAKYRDLSGGSWRGKDAQTFFNVLKEKGFHAIVDDMDAGVYGEMPMVLFDSTRVGSKTATSMSTINTQSLMKTLTDIPNRK